MVIKFATFHTSKLLVDRSKYIHKLLNFSAADIIFTSNIFEKVVAVKLDGYFAQKSTLR